MIAEPTRPFVSVIVPVYDNEAGLNRCLDALALQTYPADRYEVIAVDNDSPTPLAPLHHRGMSFRLLRERRPGSYAARNKGLKAATGEVVAFTDADCVPEPAWIERAVQALRSHERPVVVAGGVRIVPRDPNRPNAAELYSMATGYKVQRDADESKFAATANMATWRSVFEAVGPFDARLKSSGDYEWGRRAYAAGFPVVYALNAVAVHPARSSIRALLVRERRIAGGRHDVSIAGLARVRDEEPGRVRAPLAFRTLMNILRDPQFRSSRVAGKIVFVGILTQIAKALENIRLRCGGRSLRF